LSEPWNEQLWSRGGPRLRVGSTCGLAVHRARCCGVDVDAERHGCVAAERLGLETDEGHVRAVGGGRPSGTGRLGLETQDKTQQPKR